MRAAWEAVAEFFVRHAGIEEYDAIVKMLDQMGWALPRDHPARARSILAIMREEVKVMNPSIDYVFLFEQLMQLFIQTPLDMSKTLFQSRIFFHVVVERFEKAVETHDDETFKLESDVLCHTENVYGLCDLVRSKLFGYKNPSTLGRFLEQFSALFDTDEPKAEWEAFRAAHRLPDVTFRRDMLRALWWIEDEVYGPTEIERSFPPESDEMAPSNVVISRNMLQQAFTGTSDDWYHLADIAFKPGNEDEQENGESDGDERVVSKRRRESDILVGETPPGIEQEDRIWSARLPIAPTQPSSPSASSDSDAGAALDSIIRQDRRAPPPRQERVNPPTTARRPAKKPRQAPKPPTTPPVTRRAAAAARRRTNGAASDVSSVLSDDESVTSSTKAAPRRGRTFWSPAEVDALVNGVRSFSGKPNMWVLIKQANPEVLRNRTNVDLKDKYRNLLKSKRVTG
ncbi:hypothetical protein PINS_up005140 [Pythium insidiosum]|nr:hypothetical protein PINS_up005140 [Pythium insidiosum]